MVVAVEVRGRNLHAYPDCYPGSAACIFGAELKLAGSDPRRQEVLRLSIVLAAEEVGRVCLDFGPQIFTQVILRSRVPWSGLALPCLRLAAPLQARR